MRIYIIFRWFALLLAFVHLVGRIATPDVSVGLDLILYNLVVLIAMLSLFQAPLHNDGLAVTSMALAIMCWGVGSLISSYSQLFGAPSNLSLLANIFYTLFYPFALIAIPRATGRKMKLSALEFLDSAIFGLGLTAIVTALLLGEVLPKYPGSSA